MYTHITLNTPPTFPCEYYQISAAQREAILHPGVPQEYRIHYTAYDTQYAPAQHEINNKIIKEQEIEKRKMTKSLTRGEK